MSQNWQDLVTLISSQHTETDTQFLLTNLLTHDERSDLAKRLAVFQALLLGEQTQRQISVQLNVSIATITRASNTLKQLTEQEKLNFEQLFNSNTNTINNR